MFATTHRLPSPATRRLWNDMLNQDAWLEGRISTDDYMALCASESVDLSMLRRYYGA